MVSSACNVLPTLGPWLPCPDIVQTVPSETFSHQWAQRCRGRGDLASFAHDLLTTVGSDMLCAK
eukprot:9467470-Pyramimonas_sp.AAC.1